MTTSGPSTALSSQWTLLKQLVRREIHQRYRGSMLGVLWSVLTPLLLLAVYTFIFTAVLNVRWAQSNADPLTSKGEFALFLFSGLMVHSFFVECLTRSPLLILMNANLVKKVVFPLSILPLAMVGASLFNFLTSTIVLLGAYVWLHGFLPWTTLWLPVIWLPYVILATGISWLLSALGVFIRDLTQLTSLLTMLLMFLSPIFYPISALPDAFRPYAYLNPLTWIIEQTRSVLLQGQGMDISHWVLYMLAASLLSVIGYACFQRMRPAFADIV